MCGVQNPLELAMDRFPGLGRDPLRPAGKLDSGIQRSVPPHPIEAIDQQAHGVAILAVVL
jgi:hypothetical protein